MSAPALRLPPCSIESEQCVIGGMLLDNHAWDRIDGLLNEPDFYRDEHRRIFRQIRRLLELGKPADVVTVAEALDAAGEGEQTGGLAYLGELAQNTPSAANIRRYAEIVRDRAMRRSLLAVSGQIADAVHGGGATPVEKLLDEAERAVLDVARPGTADEPTPIRAALVEVVERMQELHDRDDQSGVTGLETGFTDLDRMTAGLQPGDLIIVAGRPSMGKTAIALNIATRAGASGTPTLIFSLEMSRQALAQRQLAELSNITLKTIRSGRLNDDEWSRLSFAMGKLHEAPIYIDESAGLTPGNLRARARRLHRQCGGLGLIVIDYLQLMTTARQGENRATELAEISRSVKALAKELQVPIIALSQLSRKVEDRQEKRPMMSDLRESGAIEQDADLILLMYREEYYRPDTPDKGIAEVIIGKQRQGETGTVLLQFDGARCRFTDADPAAIRAAREAAHQAKPMRRRSLE